MKKVLVVDDAAVIIKIVSYALGEAGHQVSSAANADEAMKLVDQQSFDIGIFDYNMPGKNGIELLRDVLKSPNGARMKIIMLTTESSTDLKEEGRRAGAAGWLVKPFQNQDLMAIMGQLESLV